MKQLPIRVVKVGGSLLDLPDLSNRLHRWLSRESPAHHVLIAGGGKLVDELRTIDAVRPIGKSAAHWMCVDLMTVTAHLLHDWLGSIPLIEDDRVLCQRLGEQTCTIFGPANWLRHSEPKLPGTKLDESWDVTSDSIAARLAIALVADELVLLKSSLPEQYCGVEQLVASEIVDPFFARLMGELKAVRLVDFRGTSDVGLELRVQ